MTVGTAGLSISGKAWEVRRILKEYSKRYTYVSEWIEDCTHTRHSSEKGQ
ncbi:Z-ring formation inhibitor MciZ [Bacillus sp. 1P06AnD]